MTETSAAPKKPLSEEPFALSLRTAVGAVRKPDREPVVLSVGEAGAIADRLDRLRANVRGLLRAVGEPGLCGRGGAQGCGARIFWVKHLSGKRGPYDADGTSHWATCPRAEHFRAIHGVKNGA